MFKKMFALASVTALAGLVTSVAASGCSSTNSVTEEGGTTPEAGKEAGPPKEAGPEEETGPSTCPTTDPIDQTTAPWKSPAAAPGSCTNAQIDALVKYIDDNPKTEYSKLKAEITDPTCAACLFVKESTGKWGVFVEKADGSFLRNNFGGCVAVVSGSDACGKAFSQYDDCLTFACQDCADQASFDKCGGPAAKGACKAAATALTTECPTVDPISACDDLATKYLFEAAARSLCVGTGDGGLDGGDGG